MTMEENIEVGGMSYSLGREPLSIELPANSKSALEKAVAGTARRPRRHAAAAAAARGFCQDGYDYVDRQPAAERAGSRHRAGNAAQGAATELAAQFCRRIQPRIRPGNDQAYLRLAIGT